DPEKWVPVFGKRSCSTKKLERDDDSKKSHPALAIPFGAPLRAIRAWLTSCERCPMAIFRPRMYHPCRRRVRDRDAPSAGRKKGSASEGGSEGRSADPPLHCPAAACCRLVPVLPASSPPAALRSSRRPRPGSSCGRTSSRRRNRPPSRSNG